MNTHPSTEYNTTKQQYKSSKSWAARSRSTTSGDNGRGKNNISLAKESTPVAASSSNPVMRNKSTNLAKSRTPPTAESALKTLGLLRPIDNKTYEFGLSNGIQMHLIESVKLCGLKKGREKSIIDMITTLCSHLTNREDEISRWIEFADKIALSSAIKFEESMQEYNDVCLSRDVAQDATKEAHSALAQICNEVQLLKSTLQTVREGVTDILNTFPPALNVFQHELQRQLACHQDSLKSECKTEISDVIEEVTRAHDTEMQGLEAKIGSLEMSLQVEEERSKSIQSQLDDSSLALEKERRIHMLVQADLKEDAEKSQSELREANEKIKSLEQQLQEERIQSKKNMSDMEAKMHEELDDIDKRVKASFKLFNEKKDKEIGKLVERARLAEASAEAASKLLSELKKVLSSLPGTKLLRQRMKTESD